ncbi:MAG TPA: hypothetical protein P5087_02495 [Eubacteriales bacterium]|nr:hypothetical protein [Eubacteriales bacterium]
MTNAKFLTVLIALLLVVILGVVCIFITDTIGGFEFGTGKSVVIQFGFIEADDVSAVEQAANQIITEENLVAQSIRHQTNLVEDVKAIVYTFDSLTADQATRFEALSTMQGVNTIYVGTNNSSLGYDTLLWGGITLAIAFVLFAVVMIFATGKLGRAQMTISSLVVTILNILATLAACMILAYIGIKVTVAGICAVLITAAFSIFLTTLAANRLANNKDSEAAYREIRKPVMFTTIILMLALIAFSASMSIYVLSITVPLFVGVIFSALTNLYVLLPMKDKMSVK